MSSQRDSFSADLIGSFGIPVITMTLFIGMLNLKELPYPNPGEETLILPPQLSTIDYTIVSPSPMPSLFI